MNGDFVFPGEMRDFDFDLEPIALEIPGFEDSGKVKVAITPNAVVVSAEFVE